MRIFVQIASYRDPELPKTIASALENATDPLRISFGICRQFNPEDGFDNIDQYRDDVRFKIDDIQYFESNGCCWARSRIQKLWRGEEYTLQIDSHHRFASGWDDTLINMLGRCHAGKPIITCYPPIYNVETEARSSDLWEMRPHFNNSNVLTRFEPVIRKDNGIRQHMFWAGGFMFTHGRFCEEVPYDPNLYFQGEEISMAVRAWTRGWDFFLPDIPCIWHQYVPRGRIRHWSDHTTAKNAKVPFHILDAASKERVKTILLGGEIEAPYGLGTVRSLADYENHAGLCFSKSYVSIEARSGVSVPVFNDSSWKDRPASRYTLRLSWKELLPELTSQNPDVVAVFVRERRIDMPCGNGIPAKLQLIENWESPPEYFNVWAYNKNPVKWGKKHVLEVKDFDEEQL